MKRLIATLIFVLLFVQMVSAIAVYIRPAIMIFDLKIKSNVITTEDSYVEVKNLNTYPVLVTPTTDGPIELSDEEPFTLQVNEARNINFTIAVSRWGTYYGDVYVKYSAEHHQPYSISSEITIHAVTNGTGINNNPPSKPQLISPANGSILPDNTVALEWVAATDSDNNKIMYYYYIDNNKDFSSPEFTGWTLKTEKSIYIDERSAYYWKIVAFDGLHYTSSDARRLSINEAPDVPALISPQNKAYLETDPMLEWTNVADSEEDNITYQLFLADNPGFISPLEINLSVNFYNTTPISLSSGKYYWAVRSYDGISKSEFSDIYQFLLCKDNSNEYCADLTIHSPINKTYDNTKILMNVTAKNPVKYMYSALNTNRFNRECNNCSSVIKTVYAREGLNKLVIKIVDYEGYEANETVEFFVDTIKPKITKTSPNDKQYVSGTNFSVTYTEDNLEGIIVIYGNKTITKEETLTNCLSGRNQECSIELDLSEYDGQGIDYYFVLRDAVHNVSSSTNTIFIDKTIPVVTIISPKSEDPLINQGFYKTSRLPLTVKVSENATLEMSLDFGKFSSLCRNCDSYNKTKLFSEGKHTLTIRAVDKAGNEGYAEVDFVIDSVKSRIIKTYPKNGEFVKGLANFTVEYDEESLKNVSLFYGTGGVFKEYFTDSYDICPPGKKQKCTVTIDLSAYDNQTVEYYFVVRSFFYNDTSKIYSVNVDNTKPVINPKSPKNMTYNTNYVSLTATVSEKVELLRSVNGGRFTTLCSNCNIYNRTSYFRKGSYSLTLLATDKSGNEGYASVNFTVA